MDIKEEAPKELKDCLLDQAEIDKAWEDHFYEEPFDYEVSLLKAQLEKCRGYIEAYGKEMYAQGLDEFLDAEKEEARFKARVEAEVKAERERIVKEVEIHSHRMNTNMYGISLTKEEWEGIKTGGK